TDNERLAQLALPKLERDGARFDGAPALPTVLGLMKERVNTINELADAARREGDAFKPAYMLDQSHNVTDPIESLMSSAAEVQRAFVQSALVDRAALAALQEQND
ncbi:hypothetical protein LTR94_035796, partial [Friedmanniomyces endolithicus]